MDFDEELDLDTLAELLDGDLEPCPPTDVPGSILQKKSESPNSRTNNEVELNNKIPVQPKYKPINLFDQETNVVSAKKTKVENVCGKNSVVHTGETDSSDDDENKSYLTESGKMIKKMIAVKPSYDEKYPVKKAKTWKEIETSKRSPAQKEQYVVDEYSGMRIVNPLIPRDLMRSRMDGRKMIKMSFIRNFIRNGDIEGDWVTMGVVIAKIPPKTSKNGKTYSIWKMTDLQDPEKLVSLFLFSNVHTEHWKTAVGTVVGILNPSILPDRDGNKVGGISLSVDHPGKLMIIGTSKDFAHCRGRRKDGTPCTFVVNRSLCEYCPYHVSKEYKKLSGKRVELQASYSGRQPSLKSKVLKGHNFIYGGEMFASSTANPATKAKLSKDKLTLNNLSLKRKARDMENETHLHTDAPHSSNAHNVGIPRSPFAAPAEFLNRQMSIPSIGARNLATYRTQADKTQVTSEKKNTVMSITPKELLKLHEQQLKDRMQKQNRAASQSESATPQLGRGFQPGDEISLDISPSCNRKFSLPNMSKLKAIRKIQEKGGVPQKNPNAVKCVKSTEFFAKVKKSLEHDVKSAKGDNSKPEAQSTIHETPKNMLGDIDVNSERFQRILNMRSSHQFEVDVEEIEKLETYFQTLEKKEQMEAKMASTTEITCDVVSCRQCKYTAHQATDLCKNENHPLRTHKAVKRFFCCTNCKRRTCAFTKYPSKPCRNCGEYSFEKTGMLKPRSGPKLENEILNIRGDEMKFLNSLK